AQYLIPAVGSALDGLEYSFKDTLIEPVVVTRKGLISR
ncbi:hypothetical protein PMI17_00887, partial [Pantoea sp. GM01]